MSANDDVTLEAGAAWRKRYRVIQRLGEGAMGIVFRAEQLDLRREVALKCIQIGGAESAELVKRFRREALALSRVSHPGLVKIFDVSEPGEAPFIAMELVRGRTLEAAVLDDPGAVMRRADAIFVALVEAVAALHEAGLVHRDLKPANVMLTEDGKPLVMDLGLAKDAHGNWTAMTGTGSMVGTPHYMPPETLKGEDRGACADIWALGCIYWYLHVGRNAFSGDTLEALYYAITFDALPDPETACPGMPPARRALLRALWERDPAKRPQNAKAVLELWKKPSGRISGARNARLTPAGLVRPSASFPPVSAAPAPRNRALLGAGVALVLAIGLALAARRAPHEPPASIAPTAASAAAESPAAPPSAASMAADALHRRERPLIARWREAEPYLSVLRQGGPAARPAIKALAERTTLQLGGSAENWRFWIELGRWLADPSRPLADARAPLMSAPERLIQGQFTVFNRYWHMQHRTAPIAAATIVGIHDAPGEPCGWLLLGLWLEQEGEDRLALNAYRQGLRVLEDIPIDGAAPYVAWTALARALDRVPGRSVEREWLKLTPGFKGSWRVWTGMAEAVAATHRPWLDSTVRKAMKVENHADDGNAIAWDLEHNQHDPAAALKFLQDEVPQMWAEWEYYMRRGQVALALPKQKGDPWIMQLTDPRPPVLTRETHEGICEKWAPVPALTLLLEGRDLKLARDMAGRELSDGRIDDIQCLADLARAGDDAGGRGTCRAIVESGQLVWTQLDAVVGDLAAPASADWLAPALAKHMERPGAPPCFRVALALWHSRSGRDAAALDALAAVRSDPHVVAQHGAALFEVLARPHWRRLARHRVDPALLARVPAGEPCPWNECPEAATAWSALHGTDAGGAVAAMRAWHERLPARDVITVGLAWAGAAAGGPAGAAAIAQARAAARFDGQPLWVLDEIAAAAPSSGEPK